MRVSSWLGLVACGAAAVVVGWAACGPSHAADLTRQTDLGRTAGLTRQTDLGRTADLTRQTDLGRTAGLTRQIDLRFNHDRYGTTGSLSKSRVWHPYPMPPRMLYRPGYRTR
jgi:hypothetical protein